MATFKGRLTYIRYICIYLVKYKGKYNIVTTTYRRDFAYSGIGDKMAQLT